MDIEARLKAASRTERNQAIVDAYKAGWSIRQIADVVELSSAGVHKIIRENQP